MPTSTLRPAALFALVLVACASPPAASLDATLADASDASLPSDAPADALPDVTIPALRAAGARTPRTAPCGDVDPLRCLLPWPSNAYTVADTTSPTGIRLAVSQRGLAAADNPDALNRSDGFPRGSAVLTVVDGAIDPSTLGDGVTGSVRVLVTEPGSAFGTQVPMRIDQKAGATTTGQIALLRAYARQRFAPSSEHLAVVMDSLHHADRTPYAPSLRTRIALGLAPPVDDDTAALFAYHAPSRDALARAGIDRSHVVQLWDFTTRSLDQPVQALSHMRDVALAVLDEGGIHVVIDSVRVPGGHSPIAAIVEGRLTEIPLFLESDRRLAVGDDGLPVVRGTHDGVFRVTIPAGTGDYPVVMYGHGLGGDIHDSAFDAEISSRGAAKVSMQFEGWTGDDIINTIASFARMMIGADASTARLAQSLTDGIVTQRALRRVLGNALAAPMLGTMVNPAAGRHPSLDRVMYAGGSLGGTMGFVFTEADPDITAAVLNVPGAAWTQFMVYSDVYAAGELTLGNVYRTSIDRLHQLSMSQVFWDRIDGVAWAGHRAVNPPVILLQESIGDPVMPNIGTDLAATASGATQLGAVLVPISGAATANMVVGANAITQFHTSATGPYDIHGFAESSLPAGVAAREQIVTFLQSNLAGTPTATIPATCVANTPSGSCDFSTVH